ncbi:MAG TPA: AAA family ATPase, partial [Solirubrobacteraceae bacterium]|nr:AAA family ATPase [Solirubrobacteraceae bacterium]
MPARVSSSRFVGREPELAELEHLLGEAADGRAHLAFVTGESGMGKTRLVDELAARATAGGARALFGECIELGSGELPYAPIVSALRQLARRGDPVLDALGPARAELAQLLPELGEPTPAPRADIGAATPQARLFEVLLGLLERLGREAPVLLVVEDLHWADRSTRDFLVFLSRALCRERVLVVGTYRSDELHRRHPLRPLLAELERSERARRIELRPFTREELTAQLTGILGAEPERGLVDRLFARSEGNPLFAEELLAAGRDGRGELPPTLRDALILRVEALPDAAQELLRVVAAGQRVEHDVLREVSGIDGRALREALREAAASGLLVPDEDGRYAFRHALLREAVVDDLLPGERSELHLALAEALERRLDDADGASVDPAAEVAHHYAEAGDRPRAFAAALRAASDAEKVHANGEAAALLERALELWHRVPDPEQVAG